MERLEDAPLLGFADAGAGVAHGEANGVLAGEHHIEADLSLAGELHRVAQQVVKHLTQPCRVAMHPVR
jgi:hypothetical protein